MYASAILHLSANCLLFPRGFNPLRPIFVFQLFFRDYIYIYIITKTTGNSQARALIVNTRKNII